jgi:hypothetical protein
VPLGEGRGVTAISPNRIATDRDKSQLTGLRSAQRTALLQNHADRRAMDLARPRAGKAAALLKIQTLRRNVPMGNIGGMTPGVSVDIPASLSPGTYSVQAVAMGIPSHRVTLTIT